MTTNSLDAQKSLILWAIWMTALTGVILWCAFLVRDVLLLLYIAGLFAIGFSPMVRLIERVIGKEIERVSVTGFDFGTA